MDEIGTDGVGEPPAPRPYVPSALDAAECPDDVAAWAAAVAPGPEVVAPLAAADPRRLSYAGRVDLLVALERQLSWFQAQQHRLLALLGAQAPVADPAGKDWIREDVACALRLSAGTAADRLELARELTRLPGTLLLLERGEITTHHARCLAEAIVGLDGETARAVESAVLPSAHEQSLANFRRAVRRAVLEAAPATTEQRHEAAMSQRRVACTPVGDGMSELWALLPDEGALAVMTALDTHAVRADPGDVRTADQRRADGLVQLALGEHGAGAGSGLPRARGHRPAVQVTVALSTLLGVDEQAAELDGVGAIPAALARHIAADPSGTWRRLVTDDCGGLIDYGRSTYRPPQDLADKVIARDRTCRFPNCTRTARRCDLDHRVAWQDGGTTAESNLDALCPRHHHLKHESGWRVRRRSAPVGAGRRGAGAGIGASSVEWISPSGHRYATRAASYPIDRTLQTDDDPDPPPF